MSINQIVSVDLPTVDGQSRIIGIDVVKFNEDHPQAVNGNLIYLRHNGWVLTRQDLLQLANAMEQMEQAEW